MNKLKKNIAIAAFLLTPNVVFAMQELTAEGLTSGIVSTIIYGLMGVLMATLGYKVVDALTPGKLSHDIVEGKNLPLAVLASSMIIGICIIIAAAISG